MLRIEGLTFAYPATDASAAPDPPLINGLSLALGPGEIVLIRGPSGCGKSTLLRLIVRLEEAQDGTIVLDGEDIRRIPVTTYRRRVALLQQLPVMTDGSVRDNVRLSFRYTHEVPHTDTVLRARLAEVELDGVGLEVPAAQLSVGQQQRLALLRLLAMRPRVLLLDEPTASLDPDAALRLMRVAARGWDAVPPALLVVSHQELPIQDTTLRILAFRDGRLASVSRDVDTSSGRDA